QECADRARSIDIPRDHRPGSRSAKAGNASTVRHRRTDGAAPHDLGGEGDGPGRARHPRPPRWRHARRCDRRQPQTPGRRGALLAIHRPVGGAGGSSHSLCHRLGHVAAPGGDGRAWCETGGIARGTPRCGARPEDVHATRFRSVRSNGAEARADRDAGWPQGTGRVGFEVKLLILLVPLALACAACGSPPRRTAEMLRAQLDADWKYWMTQYPETATAVGYPGQNGRWTDYSQPAIDARAVYLKRSLER